MTQAQRLLIREGLWNKFVDNYNPSFLHEISPKTGGKLLSLKEYLELFSTPSYTLRYAFDWSKSKEGSSFWYDLHCKLVRKQYERI